MKHFKQLDGLRFIAVFLVLIEHFAIIIGRHISAGYYGVDLFFVISGFLITNILIKSNEPFGKAYKKFIGRRTLRIFPIYYLTIIVLFAIGNDYVRRYLIYCITYTYNYAWVYFNIPTNLISHFWSLCVEEQFYLFWPFIILGLKNNLPILKYIVLTLVLVCSIQLYLNIFETLTPYNGVSIFPQANSLGIGALGAILYKENKISSKLLENKWVEYLGFSFLLILLFTNYNVKFIICPILSLFIILKTTHKGFSTTFFNNFLNNKKIAYIGSISYGIYLYHLPLGHYFTEHIFNPFIWDKINWSSLGILKKMQWHSWIIKLPLYGLLSIILAHFSYKYFEKPILSLKDKWFKYG
jgi:peptidoglycan/LPS O-acetylase OafA/YrhL